MSEQEHKSKMHTWIPILGIGLLAAGGADLYLGHEATDMRAQFAALQRTNGELQARLSGAETVLRNNIDGLRADLEHARAENDAGLAIARTSVTRHADAVASRIAKKQEEQARTLNEELDKVKESTLEASTRLDGKIDGVDHQVGSVRSDVETAKTDIQDTKSELQRARGDMGTMSGLIATNSKQIQTLRDLGDRNIFEFTLARQSGMQKVGDIQVMLRSTDVRHNRYSVDILADDKRVGKKDRSVNEPVQFYTGKARQPYEIVVNQVGKDKIVGYLATPKVTVSRLE